MEVVFIYFVETRNRQTDLKFCAEMQIINKIISVATETYCIEAIIKGKKSFWQKN